MAENTQTAERVNPPQNPAPASAPAPAEPAWKRLHRNSNPRLRGILIVSVVVLVIIGLFFLRYMMSYENTDDAQIDGHLNSISARVSGHVLKLLVDDNQFVKAGTPLVQIDPKDYEIALERAKADYANAVALAEAAQANVPVTTVDTSSQVSSAQAGVESAEAGIAAAQQQYSAANAQLAQAAANDVRTQSDLARYKQLVDKEEISQQQYDQALAAAKASTAAVEAATASASAASHQVDQAKARLANAHAVARSASTGPQQVTAIRARAQSAEAEVQQKKAALAAAQLNLSYTLVIAPVDGIITNRTVEAGQNVQVGQDLMRVVNLDDIWVTADFKETQLRHMRVGQPVTIHVDTTDTDYKGHVQSIAGASGSITSLLPPENATGNFVKVVQRIPVKITFDPGETRQHILVPGMSVEPKVWLR
jgi:membrane fusion protein (multidrug efflux system)